MKPFFTSREQRRDLTTNEVNGARAKSVPASYLFRESCFQNNLNEKKNQIKNDNPILNKITEKNSTITDVKSQVNNKSTDSARARQAHEEVKSNSVYSGASTNSSKQSTDSSRAKRENKNSVEDKIKSIQQSFQVSQNLPSDNKVAVDLDLKNNLTIIPELGIEGSIFLEKQDEVKNKNIITEIDKNKAIKHISELQVIENKEDRNKLATIVVQQYWLHALRYDLTSYHMQDKFSTNGINVKVDYYLRGYENLYICTQRMTRSDFAKSIPDKPEPSTDPENDMAKITILFAIAAINRDDYQIIPFGRSVNFGLNPLNKAEFENYRPISRAHVFFVRHKDSKEIFAYVLGNFIEMEFTFNKEITSAFFDNDKGMLGRIKSTIFQHSTSASTSNKKLQAVAGKTCENVDFSDKVTANADGTYTMKIANNENKLIMIPLNKLPNGAQLVDMTINDNPIYDNTTKSTIKRDLSKKFMEAFRFLEEYETQAHNQNLASSKESMRSDKSE